MSNLDTIGVEFVRRIQEEFEKKKLVDLGTSKRSINYKISDNKLIIEGIARVLFLNFGRRSGTRPPFDVIRAWVQRKLDVPDESIDSVAYAICNKIEKYGTDILTDNTKGLQLELILNDMIKEITQMVTIFEANRVQEALLQKWTSNGFN